MENLFAIYALVAALCAPFLGILVFVKQRQARRRERALVQEVARLKRVVAEQQKQFDYVPMLESLRVGQQGLTQALLRSGENEAEGRRQLVQEFSKVVQAMVNLADSVEAKTPSNDTLTMPVVQDWLADLPTEPEARLAALKQRKSALQQSRRELRVVLRDCNGEIAYARRALFAVNAGTQKPSAPIIVDEAPEPEGSRLPNLWDLPADTQADEPVTCVPADDAPHVLPTFCKKTMSANCCG